MSHPSITVKDPASAFISAEVRFMGWREMRRLISRSGCGVMEKWTSPITKRFHITGDQETLSEFIRLAWHSETLGRQFREGITEACK